MDMKQLLLTGGLCLILASCASAEHQAMLAGEEVVAVNENGEEVICRYERALGTRLAERVCRTREQIENERAEQENSLDRRNYGPDGMRLPPTVGGFGGG